MISSEDNVKGGMNMQRKWQRRWQRLAKMVAPPLAAGLLIFSVYNPVYANPAGGTVTSGAAAITVSGATTTINQTTNKAAINWQSFNIASGETVNFVQPSASSIALNRVVGSGASAIYGTLSANGKVFLINPNGVLFAPGSQVNVGGLVASTLNISDSDFLNDSYTFSGSGVGSVVNQGTITAATHAVLIGPQVKNEGVIAAQVTALAAGNKVSLDFSGDKLLNVTVDTGAVGGSVANSGQIIADGGLVVMSAGTKEALLQTVVNNSGVIKAQSVNNVNGVIRLAGNTVTNSGTLDASGKATGQTGGTVKVLGDNITLVNGSSIDVSGDKGGGTALIGGAYQGGGSEDAATNTIVENGATIHADAITSGNGGQVVVWANDTTKFAGTITARGGSVSGNGGSVETSGKKTLKVADTASVNTLAAKGISGNWLLDPVDFTIAASGGDITGAALSANLGNGNVTILSSDGTVNPSGNGDINVNDAIGWSSGNTLNLSANRNININAGITAIGVCGLTLGAGGTISVPASVSIGGSFTLTSGTWNQNSASLPGFYAKDFRITGGTFIRAKGGDGAGSPYQIADVYGLQGIGSSGMLGKYYVLANNIDASGTKYWNGDAGFVPIGTYSVAFSGSFDGGGHTIDGLVINRPAEDYIGLFGHSTGVISNVGLTGGSAAGWFYVGGLVGWNTGTVTNSYSTRAVTGRTWIGGLVGGTGGTVKNSYSTGAVTGSSDSGNLYVGGLVGGNYSGMVENSYSTGKVTGSGAVGGLLGINTGTVTNSYSTGEVTGSSSGVGGLVGYNYFGMVTNSYSTRAVTGSSDVGGLVGHNESGTVTNSYSTGAVTGSSSVGGLVGYNEGYSDVGSSMASIKNSYSTGDVTGSTSVGGLVGLNDSSVVGGNSEASIENSYSTGAVTGSHYAGGLVGRNYSYSDGGSSTASIGNSYSTGAVTGRAGSTAVGGLVGHIFSYVYDTGTSTASITDSYYATTGETGTSINSGVGYNSLGVGKTLAELKDPATFSTWELAATGGTTSVWRIYAGYTTPLLRSFLTPVTVTVSAAGATKTYDGTVYSGSTGLVYSLPNVHTALIDYDQLTYSGGGVNAGSYTITPGGLYSGQQGYDISYGSGTLIISPAALTVTANNASKYYGMANPAFTAAYSGLAAGDTLNGFTGSLNFTTTAGNTSPSGRYAISLTGTLASPNYTVSYVNGTLTVTQAPWQNNAYQGAVVHADRLVDIACGSLDRESGSLLPGYRGLSGAGYLNNTTGGVLPLTILEPGINLSGLTPLANSLPQ
jgi:filamentous hemagglutinin family protein